LLQRLAALRPEVLSKPIKTRALVSALAALRGAAVGGRESASGHA
jgi:hypothetical protein